MSPKRREMHFGVFVLGTGNHSAGWRYDGAATSNNDLSVIQEIARHAERGKFDLLFVSDGLVMDPGDHPSAPRRGTSASAPPCRPASASPTTSPEHSVPSTTSPGAGRPGTW